jgi:hypothetical protein
MEQVLGKKYLKKVSSKILNARWVLVWQASLQI